MKLVYVTPTYSTGPSNELIELFNSDVDIIKVDSDTSNKPVIQAETQIRERGIDLYDPDNFLLCPHTIFECLQPMARNAINSGFTYPHEGEGIIELADTHVFPLHISKLPSHGDTRALIVAVHPDNEVVAFSAKGHKLNNHPVHVLAVTAWPDERQEKMVQIYQDYIGLEKGEWTMLPIKDTELRNNQNLFINNLQYILDEFEPTVIIQTPYGLNDDHNVAARVSKDFAKYHDINFLFGDAIEAGQYGMEDPKDRFNPRIWQIIDGKHIGKLMEMYLDLDSAQYPSQVSDLARKRMGNVAVSKLLSYYFKRLLEDRHLTNDRTYEVKHFLDGLRSDDSSPLFEPIVVGAYGHEIVNLKIGYRNGRPHNYEVPNMTKLFEGRDLTR
jgi:hypothetical protein